MKEKQSNNLEPMHVAGLVSTSTSIIVFLLFGCSYTIPLAIVYIVLAFPFSLGGALLGKRLGKNQTGIWVGAIAAVVLEFWWLYSNTSSLTMSD